MAPLGSDNGDIKPSEMNPSSDFSYSDTQPFEFDSQYSFLGDKADNEDSDQLDYLQSTVPFDDYNVQVEDGLETQALNLGGETQVLNFDGETQVLDDLDCFENMETQLLDEFNDAIAADSDSEGMEGTEILDQGDEVSNDEIVTGDCGQFLVQKKESLEQHNASTNEQMNSGIHGSTTTPDIRAVPESKSTSVRFTSVRAAALHASGLAARKAALRGMNGKSCFIQTGCQFSDQCTIKSDGSNPNVVEKMNQAQHLVNREENSIGLRHGTSCRVGSTVRKLFAERSSCRSENADARDDLLQFPASDGQSAGLSYIDSEEPGELLQANALNFVERFVNDKMTELDDQVDLGKSTGRKSLISCAIIGPQSLAKKTVERTAGETQIFDWDDALEDEGGGGIYCRRKEESYGDGSHAQKNSNHANKPKGSKLNESCNVDQPNAHDKEIVDSDSKSLLCKSKDNGKPVGEGQLDFRKNLLNEFDEQCNSDSSRGQLEAAAAAELNVGFDTQISAEAMEALFYGDVATDVNGNLGFPGISKGSSKILCRGKCRKRISSREFVLRKGVYCYGAAPVTRQSKRTRVSSVLQNLSSKNVWKECDTDLLLQRTKKAKSNNDKNQNSGGINMTKMPSKSIKKRKAGGALTRSQLHGTGRSTMSSSIKKRHLEEVCTVTPIAHRTRQSLVMNAQVAEASASDCRKGKKLEKEVGLLQENRTRSIDVTDVELSLASNAEEQLSKFHSNQSGEHGNVESCNDDQLHLGLIAGNNGNHGSSYPKHRSSRKMSVHVGESDNLEAQSEKSVQLDNEPSIPVVKKSRRNNMSTCIRSTTVRITRSSRNTCPVLHFPDQNSEGKLSRQSSDKQGSKHNVVNCNSTKMNRRTISTSITGPVAAKEIQHSGGNHVAVSSPISENLAVTVASDESPEEKSRSLGSLCTTPVNCPTPINAASPVCMGEEYFKQSCKKNLSKSLLIKELRSLSPIDPEPIATSKDMRKRRDLADIRVLFSNHLNEDIIKQQKKILARLGISEASSILAATHFVTDKFVRTRNMLEAIASGKPVVTHLWLESIGQVNIHIDEDAYILRDIKKEKEFGFCMPSSLARARRRPLLQGRRILITPNTKPNKETIVHLVAVLHGQALERIGRSAMKDDKVLDDLLILSCEEDYAICVPFLEKGAAVYSSELLLNGIVTQKLDYERHRLFSDHVRKTRSTIWLRKDNRFLPVTKHK
ncbi:hypothetical protein ES288_A10G121700v1 [Gossypium darwinii]|uniref:BRCT domain-containing protein n=1 Tax=Gossypium darwinii TaxID=34276 RepID=A0A5D2EZC1_GOSDA|nr:hypothetical protein ES288_A10G121700v1 [Gossypium darwinii]